MDVFFDSQARDNTIQFKRSLDRIIEKYSKLQYHNGGIEVDLHDTSTETIQHYMATSKTELKKLKKKSLTDLRDESLGSHNITRDLLLDLTHQDVGADDTSVSSLSSTQFSVEEVDAMSKSSLDESRRNLSETELQPEDQDEELEMTLRSHGSSLVELYPRMISRIERAWRRRRVSEAADSVLRRYRRWRQQPSRNYLNNTFTVTQRRGNPKKTSEESSGSPVKAATTPQSPLWMVTNPQGWKAQLESPGRGRGLLRKEQHQPILVIGRSRSSEAVEHKEISLNDTFDVSEEGEQPSRYACGPSRPSQPSAKAFFDPFLRPRLLSLAAPQADDCSLFASHTTAVSERADSCSSPVGRSPFKARMGAGESRSPLAFSQSPKSYSVEGFSREPLRPRSTSASLSSPPHRPAVSLRMLGHQDPRLSLQTQAPPQSAAAAARHRLRRPLSFDSSLPSAHISYLQKKLDDDFVKLYHRVVCQNNPSILDSPPCRFCGRSSEASRGRSSSALAALALSPHCSLLRKRHREVGWGTQSESKRPRDQYYTSSPGSKRHRKEVLRHRLSESEPSADGLCYSPSGRSLLPGFCPQQPSANKHQDTWMSRAHNEPAAEPSGLGGSQERRMADGYSSSMHRKW